jgi:hypothetical protein
MDPVSESLEHSIHLCRKYVEDQERRIERQRSIVAGLEIEGSDEAAKNARIMLGAMEDLLLKMRHDLAEAEGRLGARLIQRQSHSYGGGGNSA